MSKIKSILAFVAVLLCGGAWAAPTVLWDGDFSSYRQGNTDTYVRTIGSETYTLKLNGHEVKTDSETGLEYLLIKEQSDSKLGVTIERTPTSSTATGGTLIMRYSDYKYDSNTTHRVAMTIDCERDGYHNILDIFANNANNTIVADWADFYNNNNSTPYSAKETSSNLEVDANDEHTIRMLTLTYGNGKGGFSFQRKVDGTWQMVYSHTGLLGSSTYVVNRFAVGGLARDSQRGNNNTSMTSTKVADGMKVYSIAVDTANQNTVPTTSTFSSFSFASDANYFATANGDANLTELSWTDAKGTATTLPETIGSTVKLAISGTGTISYSGSFSGSVYLHKNVKLVPSSVSNAKVAGSGTIVYDANNTNTAPSFTVDNAWTGTVWLKNLRSGTYSSNKNQALATPATLNNLGKTKSIIKMTNCAGYVNDGNNDSTFPWILELDGDSAWENLSGWSARTRTYGGLKGDGVLGFFGMGVNSHCSEVERFTDASNFSGSINVGNDANPYYTGKRVIIGSDNLATGDSGQILVSSGKTVTVANDKTWTANAMFVNGTIKGSGTINANFTLKNGATIDLTGNAADAALTLESNHTLTLGDSINLVNPTEGGAILKGVATEPEGLALRMVTVNGAVVDGAHLYYDDNAIKYSAQVATTWTPRDSAITDEIFDWTATDAWTDLSGNAATWPSDQATASALDINLDTTKIKGIKVTGQVYVGNLAVAGTLESEESFQFYNHLLEEGVDNDHEVNPNGDGHDCLHAKSVNLTKLEGGLGLKVPITGSIAFGADTQLTFVTGSAQGEPSTAYAYEFVDRGGSITVSGEGKFNVPSSMYGLPFSVDRTATIVYTESKDISGVISGEGNVITKGSGTTTLTAENTVSGGITVEAGTLKSGSNSAFGTGTITVDNGAALDFAGFDSNATGYTVVCNGGTLNATGTIYADHNCIKSLTLGGDSEINGSGRIGVTMADASATTLDLGTYTLTVNGGAYLNLRNTTVSGTGTIDVSNGTLLPWGNVSSASNVSLNLGANGHAEMNVGLTVKNFSMASGATFTGTNNSAITVTGKLSGTGSIPKLTLGNGATIDTTGNITVSNTLTFGNSLKVTGNVNDVIIKGSTYSGALPSVTRVDAEGSEIAETRTLVNVSGAIMFGNAYDGATISASELNAKGDAVIISGDLTINLDKDIVGAHGISATQNATVTIKPSGKKTFVSAADVKKLSFSSNITVNYVWNVPTQVININFGSSDSGVMSGDTTDKTFGGEDIPRSAWNGYSANSETSAAVSTGWDCANSETFEITGMTVGYSGRGGNHNVGTKITPCAPFMWGYIDDNSSSDVQVTLSGIPFDRYDVIVYFQGDTAAHFFSTPQIKKGDTTTVYSYDSEMNVVTSAVANNFHWGQSLQSDISYEKNVFRIPNQTGDIKVQPQRFIDNNGQRRATIAAIQIVALPAAMIVDNGVTTYYPTVVEALEAATDKTNVIVLDGSTILPDGFSSYAVGDAGVVVAADAKIGEKGYATLQHAIDAAGPEHLADITIIAADAVVPLGYRVKGGVVMTAAKYHEKWTNYNAIFTKISGPKFAYAANASRPDDKALMLDLTSGTESEIVMGTDCAIPGHASDVTPWKTFTKAGGNQYVDPGHVLRIAPGSTATAASDQADIAAGIAQVMEVDFPSLSLGGLIVESGAPVFKITGSGDRQTFFGDQRTSNGATAYFDINENIVIARSHTKNNNASIKFFGDEIWTIADDKKVTLNASEATEAKFPALDTDTRASVKVVGGGQFVVSTIKAIGEVTLDFSKQDIDRETSIIDGTLVVDESTTIKLPEGMEAGDTFKIATTINGTLDRVNIKIGNEALGPLISFAIENGAIVLSEIPMAAKIVNGDTTTYYETLADAVANVGTFKTVTLLADVELSETLVVNEGKYFYLDLAGHSIAMASGVMSEAILVKDGAALYLQNLTENVSSITANGEEAIVCEGVMLVYAPIAFTGKVKVVGGAGQGSAMAQFEGAYPQGAAKTTVLLDWLTIDPNKSSVQILYTSASAFELEHVEAKMIDGVEYRAQLTPSHITDQQGRVFVRAGITKIARAIKPGTTTEPQQTEPTAADLAEYAPAPVNDEADAAGQAELLKVVKEHTDAGWVIKSVIDPDKEVVIDDEYMTINASMDVTAVAFAQVGGLEAVAGAAKTTPVVVPAAKVVPGLYYSISYGTKPDNHTDESDRVLATGSDVTIPVPVLGKEKVYYIKVKASATK